MLYPTYDDFSARFSVDGAIRPAQRPFSCSPAPVASFRSHLTTIVDARTIVPGIRRLKRQSDTLIGTFGVRIGHLVQRGLDFERERAVTVRYRGVAIPGQRIDLIVSKSVLVELKAATRIDLSHEARMISYLRTTGLRLGLLLNFNCPTLKEGVQRIVV